MTRKSWILQVRQLYVLNENQFSFSKILNTTDLDYARKSIQAHRNAKLKIFYIFLKLIKYMEWSFAENKTTAVVQLYSIFNKKKGRELMSMS